MKKIGSTNSHLLPAHVINTFYAPLNNGKVKIRKNIGTAMPIHITEMKKDNAQKRLWDIVEPYWIP